MKALLSGLIAALAAALASRFLDGLFNELIAAAAIGLGTGALVLLGFGRKDRNAP